MLLICGAECFTPEPLGEMDVLVAGGEVIAIAPPGEIKVPAERIDASGKLMMPGIVDALTHPCGGGGEGGFVNRTPELSADDFVSAGVTTPVGALGTDSLGRSLEVLYATIMGLRAKGLRAYMFSGAYRMPAPTLTGDVARDVYLIEPIIGVGEVAVADHRGTQPSAEELRRLAAEVQLGGILTGEGGTVLVHVGAGPSRLSLLREAIDGSDLPARILYPTHVNRSHALLQEAAQWALRGAYVDITVSTTPELIAAGDIPTVLALRTLLEAGAPADHITLSSDAGGSLPWYVDGELRGLTAAAPGVLPELLGELMREDTDLLPMAIAAMTRNPAAALGLHDVGAIVVGQPADITLLDRTNGGVAGVLCRGRWLKTMA
ncbi:MAG: amidohydrolase family protein [Congregibacter sp.]